MVDSSIDLKGPTSSPEGEMTPNIAASNNMAKLELLANIRPDNIIKTQPNPMIFLLPIPSAYHVSKYDSKVSPSRVNVIKIPI
ncbi:hypothetical protein WICPIJ_005497 [Wickerhamomyces pijperi]|uniref:Uncharacterized protein n=1 Tax=Wickerhamomyces pijperi TaxID=599730 RepID=A0A9P8Q3E5_WICPI|nr:hypothetical protein WICPIJ_005497 [Wickerhamomyces pijperi]